MRDSEGGGLNSRPTAKETNASIPRSSADHSSSPLPGANADTGITVFQPQQLNVAGFGPAVTVVGTSDSPGPTSCPGASSEPDPGSTCSGMHIRLAASTLGIGGTFVPVTVGNSPDPVTKRATTGTACLPDTFWRGEFFQTIANPAPGVSRTDLRWGPTLYTEGCAGDITVPVP